MTTTKKAFLLSVVFLTATVNLFSQTAEEWKKLGNVQLDSANYIKAIEFYQKAIEVDSNYFDAYHNIGLAYLELADFDKSIEFYSKAILKNDTIVDTYFSLGSVYAQKEDFDNAIKQVKRGISLNPDSPQGIFFLGFLYQEKGNYLYADLYARRAAQLGDSTAREFFAENDASWEDNFRKPDYDEIEKNIADKASNFYYPKLWDRYQQGDSTLTIDEARHIYYGYVFKKNYSSLLRFQNTEEIYAILDNEEPTQEEWEQLVLLINTALQLEPFSCRYLYYQSIAYSALKKEKEAIQNDNKIQCILSALTSTGDALTKETAMHVITVATEYDYLFLYNIPRGSQALITGGFDVLYVGENEYGIEEMWFDVNQSLNNMFKE